MPNAFPLLFSPFEIRGTEFRNRIFFSGHGTRLADGAPGDELIAYHTARARGGAALIVTEAVGVHETSYYVGRTMSARSDDCIPAFRALTKAVQGHGCKLIGQLFHAGREMATTRDGNVPLTYSPSDVPNERFRLVARPMPQAFIHELIACYGAAAVRFAEAGMDGIEILANHGYLLGQFFNPRVNRRTDEYGGSAANRARIAIEIAAAIRQRIPAKMLIGLRLSGDERGQPDGIEKPELHELLRVLKPSFDYFSVTVGSTSTLAGAVHIVPPMSLDQGYVAPVAGGVRAELGKPVFVAGRINRPDVAERILASGQADMCAMTRGMIADPEIANKSRAGRIEDIRTCIGCNQSCAARNQRGLHVSCIQYPESGRELEFGMLRPAARAKRVLVAGGGPGGLKAASVAAARGHKVTLYERASRLGGQVNFAERLPGRMEFGGITENLAHEARKAGVEIVTGRALDASLARAEAADAIIVATGAKPRAPELPGGTEGAQTVDAWQVIQGQANLGGSVVVFDWRCDWVGLGVAEMLAREGRRVRLASLSYMPGEAIQQYVRDPWLGELHKLGVEIVPMVRLIGADSDSVYLQHVMSEQPVILEGVDSLVTSWAREADMALEQDLEGYPGAVIPIGDCLSPRTAEEAVIEGLRAAWSL
ncbi:MAG: oxidoreductase [Alphaproteobacteria bacterium]